MNIESKKISKGYGLNHLRSSGQLARLVRPRYTWEAPKYFVEQEILCYDHRGNMHRATIRYLETKYSNGIARHQYGVQPDGWKHWLWITEKEILIAPERYATKLRALKT